MIESGWRVSLHAFSHPKCSLLPPPTKCKYLHHISTAAAASSSKTNAASQTVDDDDDDDNDCVQQQKQQEQGLRCERDVRFAVGNAFYRSESSLGRDLGVLAAAAHKLEKGSLRVLDAMCGCGVRAMRYIMHSGADFVLANDACKQFMLQNLERCSVIGSTSILTQSHCLTDHILTAESSNWKVTHVDANRLLSSRYLANDYFDLIDVDSFGSSSVCLRSALAAVRHGGLLYVTSTDGVSSGGRRPYNALAAYGAFVRQMPYCNEIGLRMLIGGVIRDAAMRNLNVSPFFSYYSYHGTVFRVMLRVRQGIMDSLRTAAHVVLLKLYNGKTLVT
ncbi:hypothetical protein O6H91_06G085700 [Diphasiastrum complanatum]|uniref:Uncharacterized protein n=1 Tax=Diphasiastrum complanatum TaxID=34168 RepID=A0ACC2DFV6_DIPCM|nr:hypothetical protein O6H91_06G085700 [Diphasiastrum complanatum]